MAGLIPKILVASVLFVASTFGGMALFGMGSDAGMAKPCAGQSCAAEAGSDAGMTAAECVGHCLRAATPDASVPPAIAISVALVILAVSVLSAYSHVVIPAFSSFRMRDGIGKLMLQRQLSTVVLRD